MLTQVENARAGSGVDLRGAVNVQNEGRGAVLSSAAEVEFTRIGMVEEGPIETSRETERPV